MPAYPCAKCTTPVDAKDLTCRNCGDKKPFSCSKCATRLGAMDIFNPEQLTFQKPLFCKRCGAEVHPVKCPKCETDVYRNAGIEDSGHVLHPECHKAVMMQRKVAPILQVGLLIFFGYAFFSQVSFYTRAMGSYQSIGMGIGAGLVGAVIGWFVGGLMAPKFKPPS